MIHLGRWSLPALAATGLVAAEWLVSTAWRGSPVLAVLALVAAPGLAVLPFLPDELRRLPVALPLVPIAGIAASTVLLISLTAVDISLTATHIRLALVALVAVAAAGSLVVPPPAPLDAARRSLPHLTVLLLLAGVTSVGVALQSSILGGKPLPGEDWGEYLLYAEQIAKHHSLLIDNPYWMLGGHPFPQDPGAPTLYAAYMLLTGHGAASLVQGIWLFAVLAILSVFVFATALWGPVAGIAAAAVYAVVPMNLDMLSWHGLANVDALVVLPLALLSATFALRGRAGVRWAAVLAVSAVALAAAHRFSFVLGLLALVPTLAIAFAKRPERTTRFLGWTAVFVALTGLGVAVHLWRLNTSLHGTQGYHAFLPTKLRWDLVTRDMTWPVIGVAAFCLVATLALRHRDDAYVLLGLLFAILALTYAWVVHVPTGYNRAAFFLPLLAAIAIGLGTTRIVWRVVLPVVAALVVATAVQARPLERDYRGFYGHTNAASLRGLGYVDRLARPGDAFVTDQCWSFLATWLLHRPVLAALDPALILPKPEVAPAEVARRILYGDPRVGRRLARARNIRFALVDPLCTYQTGEPYGTPRIGRLIYASTRLLVLELAR